MKYESIPLLCFDMENNEFIGSPNSIKVPSICSLNTEDNILILYIKKSLNNLYYHLYLK